MTPSKAQYPFLGTWKMVGCESSHPELPHPTSALTTFSEEADGIHYRAEMTWSDGRTTSTQAVLSADGSWCPMIGSALADAVSVHIHDDGSLEARMRKGQVTVGTLHTKVSADGQTSVSHWDLIGTGIAITWKTTAVRQ
jgi:hypothetical protein